MHLLVVVTPLMLADRCLFMLPTSLLSSYPSNIKVVMEDTSLLMHTYAYAAVKLYLDDVVVCTSTHLLPA